MASPPGLPISPVVCGFVFPPAPVPALPVLSRPPPPEPPLRPFTCPEELDESPAPPPPPDPLIGFPLFTPGPLKTEVLPLLPLAGPVAPPSPTVIG